MPDDAAAQKRPRVTFRLYCFSNEDAVSLLPPEGTMIIQYLQFPIDFEDCTCIPTGGVGYWSKAGVTDLDAQWYGRERQSSEKTSRQISKAHHASRIASATNGART